MGFFVLSCLLILAAVGLLIAAAAQRKRDSDLIRIRFWAFPIPLVMAILLMLPAVLYTVPSNHTGVLVLFGQAQGTSAPGLHLKLPFASVSNIPGLAQESTYSNTVDEGEKGGPDAVAAVTADNAVINVDATVLWNLDLGQARSIYEEYRDLDQIRQRLLRPTSRDVIRGCVLQHNFEEARTTARSKIAECIDGKIASATGDAGIIIRNVQIRKMEAQSADLQASIDRKLAAEQAAREAEFRKEQAEVDAETAEVRARGEAEAQIERARGEAEANKLLTESLTPEVLQNRLIEAYKEADSLTVFSGSAEELPDPVIAIPQPYVSAAQ